MRTLVPGVVMGLVTIILAPGVAAALEGEFTNETRQKLRRRITVREEHVSLGKLLHAMVEETGLSVVVPVAVAQSPEPIAIAAEEATVEELIDCVAFALRLEVMATPNGVIAFRLPEDDPRRELVLRRYREPPWDRERAERPPRLPPEEVIERVMHNPKVRRLLERAGAEIFPQKFHPEKRVWILAVRREGEERPLAVIYASDEGEVIGIEDARWNDAGEGEGDERRKQKAKRKEHF